MHLPIVRANSGACDVVILYPSQVVFADSVRGVRYIERMVLDGVVPFATLSAPDQLATPEVIARLSGYEHCSLDLYADVFVEERGIVRGAEFATAARSLPATAFWRALAALYACELNRSSAEW